MSIALRTSVYNVLGVEVVDRVEHLSNRLRSVFLCELAALANAIEQLSSCRKLSDDVVLVLKPLVSCHPLIRTHTNPPSTRTTRGI